MHNNHLIHESSPYLLQHAHNPVDWFPWNDEAWKKAKDENKLVLISIGYSSCHWCHVMERESFEDDATAELMNKYFVCIKVDREERPDVDQIYMSAVQLMTGQGGWPLNCFCLPDGKPVYGGTYFPNSQWRNVMLQLQDFYSKNPDKARAYAEELTKGVSQLELVTLNKNEIRFSKDTLRIQVENWKKYFDHTEGGPNRAPKFPMPNNYEFLLNYAFLENEGSLKNYVLLTLDKMAFGGIYDQVGGGFARYSTDLFWKAPHFEKMLYDNAQLVSLYAHAFQLTQKGLYKQVIEETLEFIEREMTSDEGGFYSALDADSEGVEGRFYVWKKEELSILLPEKHFNIILEYYHVEGKGLWEHGNSILLRKETDEIFAKKHQLKIEELNLVISKAKEILLRERNKRVRPGLDDKQLTSWNALMIKGYCDAYDALGEIRYLHAAAKNADIILTKLKRDDNGLNRSYKNNKASINGYLEDYSFIIEAFVKLFETTGVEKYLEEANQLAQYAIKHFFDPVTGMFFFTSALDPELIARKKEIHDNVIPSSNSSMAKALFLLGKYLDNDDFIQISRTMLHNIQGEMMHYGSSYSNWSQLMIWNLYPFYEIAISGANADEMKKELDRNFLPNKIVVARKDASSKLPLLNGRFVEGKTLIYVCENYTCKLPYENVAEAIAALTIVDL